MFKGRPFLGTSLAMIAAAMTDAFRALRPDSFSHPAPVWSKNVLRREKTRIEGPFPNANHGAVHNGTAFVYNSEREAARRVRQRTRGLERFKAIAERSARYSMGGL